MYATKMCFAFNKYKYWNNFKFAYNINKWNIGICLMTNTNIIIYTQISGEFEAKTTSIIMIQIYSR